MEQVRGTVIATHKETPLSSNKSVIEIQLEKVDEQLLKWQNKKVVITMIES